MDDAGIIFIGDDPVVAAGAEFLFAPPRHEPAAFRREQIVPTGDGPGEERLIFGDELLVVGAQRPPRIGEVALEDLGHQRLRVGQPAPLQRGQFRLRENLRQGDVERRLVLNVDGAFLKRFETKF